MSKTLTLDVQEDDIEGLRIIEPDEDVPFVLEAIKKVVKELNGTIPLIGFNNKAGAVGPPSPPSEAPLAA